MGLTLACFAGALFGFVPTGIVAAGYAVHAASLQAQRLDARSALIRSRRWLLATLLIGAAVEAPVLAHALVYR